MDEKLSAPHLHDPDASFGLSFDALLEEPCAGHGLKLAVKEGGLSESPPAERMIKLTDPEVYKMPISVEEIPPQDVPEKKANITIEEESDERDSMSEFLDQKTEDDLNIKEEGEITKKNLEVHMRRIYLEPEKEKLEEPIEDRGGRSSLLENSEEFEKIESNSTTNIELMPQIVPEDNKCQQEETYEIEESTSTIELRKFRIQDLKAMLEETEALAAQQKLDKIEKVPEAKGILRVPLDGSPSPRRGRSSSAKAVRFDETADKNLKRGPGVAQRMAFKRMLIQRRGNRVIQKIRERKERMNSSESLEPSARSDSFSDESDSESSSYSENITTFPKSEKKFRISNNSKQGSNSDFSHDSIRSFPTLAKGADFPVKRVPEKSRNTPENSQDTTDFVHLQPAELPIPLTCKKVSKFSSECHVINPRRCYGDVFIEDVSGDVSELTTDYDFADDRSETESESFSYGGHDIVPEDMTVEEIREKFSKINKGEQQRKTRNFVRYNSAPKTRKNEPRKLPSTQSRRLQPTPPKRRPYRRSASLPISKKAPSLQEDVFQFLPTASVFGSAFQKLLDTDESLQTSI